MTTLYAITLYSTHSQSIHHQTEMPPSSGNGPSLMRTRSGDLDLTRRRGQTASGASRQTKIVAYVVCFLIVYVSGMTVYEMHFAGIFVPDTETDEFGRTRVRRRPHRHKTKLDPNKKT